MTTMTENNMMTGINDSLAIEIAAKISVEVFPSVESPLILDIVRATLLEIRHRFRGKGNDD